MWMSVVPAGYNACMKSETVLVRKVERYELHALLAVVEKSIVGDLSGKRLLVKPNLLSARDPAEAVTTHPALVEAVCRVCRERGAEVVVGDSPAGDHGNLGRLWEKSGMATVAVRCGVELVSLESAGAINVEVEGVTVSISRIIEEVDGVVNLPKLKTHSLTGLTCAVKNTYGLVPGVQKTRLHALLPAADAFARMLLSLHGKARVLVSVVDAVECMEGEGPASGRVRRLGCILAGRDATLVDIVACAVVGVPPSAVSTLRALDAEGGGVAPVVEGDTFLAKGPAEPLRLPSAFSSGGIQRRLLERAPAWLTGGLWRLLKPRPCFTDGCVGCGICVEICPVDALRLYGGEVRVDASKCIACGCCQEACPRDAIRMRLGPVASLGCLMRGRG